MPKPEVFNPFSPRESVMEKLRRQKNLVVFGIATAFAGGQIPMHRDMVFEHGERRVETQEAPPQLDTTPTVKSIRGKLRIEMPASPLLSDEMSAVPQEYARNFDHAKSMDQYSYDNMVAHTEQEIRKDMATHFYGLSYQQNPGQNPAPLHDVRITAIHITGMSSPEAYRFESPTHQSTKPGEVEEANVELAGDRGEQVAEDMKQVGVIKKLNQAGMGADESVLAEAARTIKAEEVQFSEAEVQQLNKIAEKYPFYAKGMDQYRAIALLVEAYNTGHVKDAGDRKELDQIVGSKRRVDIVIEYEAQAPEKIEVPVPLLAMDPVPPLPPDKKVTETKKVTRRLLENYDPNQTPAQVRQIDPPEPSDPKYDWMVWQTYVKDLSQFFNKEQTIQRGCDYVQLTHDMYRDYDRFKTNKDRTDYLATKILEAWMKHDRAARNEAGEYDNNNGLDHLNDPEQIRWAKIHATALLDLVNRKLKNDKAFDTVDQVRSRERIQFSSRDGLRMEYTRLLTARTEEIRKKYPMGEG
ncbi:hypothetical protein HZC53_05545 [Candidatus Uhrbacteria bacterium]|nr:hypothetical protein [Candidatus Uhrbacteria bacterium]